MQCSRLLLVAPSVVLSDTRRLEHEQTIAIYFRHITIYVRHNYLFSSGFMHIEFTLRILNTRILHGWNDWTSLDTLEEQFVKATRSKHCRADCAARFTSCSPDEKPWLSEHVSGDDFKTTTTVGSIKIPKLEEYFTATRCSGHFFMSFPSQIRARNKRKQALLAGVIWVVTKRFLTALVQ